MNKKNKIFVIILILLIGCKKTNDITEQIRKDELGTENISVFENKARVAPQEKITVEQDEQVIIEPELVEINIYAEYLKEYFPDNDYILLELNLNNREIYFAEHYIKEPIWEEFFDPDFEIKMIEIYGRFQPAEKIFDTAVVFEMTDGKFYRYLLIKDFKFFNVNDFVSHDFSVVLGANPSNVYNIYGIYGFTITHRYYETDSVPPNLAISTYVDYGCYEIEPFYIRWDEESKVYEDYDYLSELFGF
jgi:hypothetical protein